MRVLVTGAYGLIGSAVLARLHRDGHALVGAGRGIADAALRFPHVQWISADFTQLTTAEAWLAKLAGIDAVVNCVGVLQDSARDDVARVQVDGTIALFVACARAGVRRVIHVSAVGAADDAPTAFARTKARADAHLAGLDLDWVILRPALVLAPAAYGGTAMLRGLAGFPFATPTIPGRVQVVGIDDVTETVALCLAPDSPAKVIWELAHPQVHTLGDIVAALRRWHGLRPQRQPRLPRFAQTVVASLAEVAGMLGWRSPARRTALAQLEAGVIADPAPWTLSTGIKPKSLDAIFAERPASVQDRWFARLYLLKPIAIVSLAAFWIATGVIALGPGREAGIGHLMAAGLGRSAAEIATVGGSLLDIALGLAVCVRRFARRALQLMLLLSLAYLLIGTVAMSQLWLDQLGPYVKIVPVMLASLFTLAILDER
jgi:uncharacterized protein YbjT (DUF2867 family)